MALSAKRAISIVRLMFVASFLLTSIGCATPPVATKSTGGYLQRAVTKSDGKISVSVSALSEGDSNEVFGVRLATRGIQPVWIRIENNEELPF